MPALRSTPLLPLHRRLGARLVPFAGYEMPIQYASVLKEHHAVRSQAGLFDVSHMGELLFDGPAALEVLDGLVTAKLSTLPVGKARYTVACRSDGGILDDLIVYRVDTDGYAVVCNASNREKIVLHFSAAAAGRDDCRFVDRSDERALLALQGPAALSVLQASGADEAALALPSFGVADAGIGPYACRVARTGYTGEDGVEIFCSADNALALAERLLEHGTPLGLRPAGLGARDTLRLEAALSLYGHELTEETTPHEAGLSWVVSKSKEHFLGAEALRAQREAGVSRKLVGFEIQGRGSARADYPVLHQGERVGHVTSGSVAPTLGKHVGLAYVPTSLAREGSELDIELVGRGKTLRAVVVPTPFYRRQVDSKQDTTK